MARRGQTSIRPGDRFGRLIALTPTRILAGNRTRAAWVCQCDCGKESIVQQHLLGKSTNSCGCLHKESVAAMATVDGRASAPEYHVWKNMIRRCSVPENAQYKDYGGRGISVCQRWLDSFADFIADMGPRPTNKHEIDRKENDGNYEPGNCRWVIPVVNRRNTRRNRIITIDGVSRCMSEWAEISGINSSAILDRLTRGWDIKEAVFTPLTTKRQRRLAKESGQQI